MTYASDSFDKVLHFNQDDSCIKFYIGTDQTVDSLINLSKKKYQAVITYAFWCKTSRDDLPGILSLLRENKDLVDVYLICSDSYDKIRYNYFYLKNHLYHYNPTFLLDIDYYKSDRNSKRMTKFIKAICPDCKTKKMGFASIIIFNQGNYLTHTNYNMDYKTKMDILKGLMMEN